MTGVPASECNPSRPVVRWHGGKWREAPWIIGHLPIHRTYVEPFGGGASVLLRKPRSYAEVYNDLDREIVNLFSVLREPELSRRLVELLWLTPFSRDEFRLAYEDVQDPVEQSRRMVVRSFMGFGSNAHASDARGHRSTGFRSNTTRSGTTPARDWMNYPDALRQVVARLRGVVVENRDAREVMSRHDGADTVHYVDPPYMHALRAPSNKHDLKFRMYRHEMTDSDHGELLAFLQTLKGAVVLSGYASPLYDEALRLWRRETRATHADGARDRVEVLWLNPLAAERLGGRLPLEAA